MAEHSVRLTALSAEILNTDVEFEIHTDGEKLGTLTVSKGGIGWYPRGASLERHMTWEEFDKLIRREWARS